MSKKLFFLSKTILFACLLSTNIYAEDIAILPLKKPILKKVEHDKKLTKGIIRPKAKPKNDQISSEEILLSPKKLKIVKKKDKEINYLVPKSKPLIVKKETQNKVKKSKYYRQKDFNIAKKSIQALLR